MSTEMYIRLYCSLYRNFSFMAWEMQNVNKQELEVAGISLDYVRIFASPFRRTVETAEAVASSMSTVAHAKPSIKVYFSV